MPKSSSKLPKESQDYLIKAFTVSFLLFYLFYLLFWIFYDPIHNAYFQTDPNTVIWWQQLYVFRDGLESRVMFAGSLIYLSLTYFLFKRLKKFPKFNWVLIFLVALPFLLLVFNTRSDVFNFASFFVIAVVLCVIGLFIYFCLGFMKTKTYIGRPYLFQIILWVLFALMVIFGQDSPDVGDYNFFVGPALKLLQGDRLGSFDIQYSLLGTLLFSTLMFFKLNINQIQFVLALIFIFWFWFWWLLASKLISNIKLRFLFIVALILTRYLALVHDPMQLPQVLPFRLDLWVILVLIVLRFGYFSWVTALVFSIIYALDNSFGLFYFAVYIVGFLILGVVRGLRGKEPRFTFRQVLNSGVVLLPLLIGPVVNLYFFKSLVNPATIWLEKSSILFAPISMHSPFWLIFALLMFSFLILMGEESKRRRIVNLLLVGFLLVEFIYFYGRSVDHNLLNISAIWVLLLFLVLDRLHASFSLKKISVLVAVSFVLIISVLFSRNIEVKVQRTFSHILSGKPLSANEVINENLLIPDESVLTSYPKNQLVILSWYDSYINYRFGLRQEGYKGSILSEFFVDDTANFLIDQIKASKSVIFWEQTMAKGIGQLNDSAYMHQMGKRFSYSDRDAFYELGLVSRQVSDEPTNYLNFSEKGLSFIYPEDWRIEEGFDSIKFQDQEGIFNLDIKVADFNSYLPREQYVLVDKDSFGQLINQGLAQIPNFEISYVRLWKDSHKETMKLYLFKSGKVVEVTVSPTNSLSVWQFEKLLSSLQMII